jgi:hypothetical protein
VDLEKDEVIHIKGLEDEPDLYDDVKWDEHDNTTR